MVDIEKTKKLKKNSRKSLKMMQKNRNRNVARKGVRIVKYGAKGFGRNIWLSVAATIVMAVTLIILFVTIVASVILTNTAEMMKDKIDITIYLKPSTSEEVLAQLSERIKEDPNIKSVTTTTSVEEYKLLLEEYKDDATLTEIINDDVSTKLVENMYSTMRIKVYDPMNLDSIKAIVETDELFTANTSKEKEPTYDVNQAEINTITSWARIARTGGVILAIVFLIISVLIIFSTIRMAIFSRREEIYMMTLVGADKGFVRGPFLIEAEICGAIAGVVAATASYFGFKFLSPKLANYGIGVDQITNIMESSQLVLVFLAFIGVGVLIGWLSSRLAVSRYLHKA